MSKLRIPKDYIPGFRFLFVELKSEELQVFISILGKSQDLTLDSLGEEISKKLDKPETEVRVAIAAIISLYGLKEDEEYQKNIIEEISDALIRQEIISESNLVAAVKAISELLSLENLKYLSRAESIKTEYDNIFISSRILTDIRPTFDPDTITDFDHVVLVHQLRILYHTDASSHKEFYIALDKNDLNELKKDIMRAEQKETLIRKKLISGGFTIIGTEDIHP